MHANRRIFPQGLGSRERTPARYLHARTRIPIHAHMPMHRVRFEMPDACAKYLANIHSTIGEAQVRKRAQGRAHMCVCDAECPQICAYVLTGICRSRHSSSVRSSRPLRAYRGPA